MWALLGCGQWGCSLGAVCWLLIAVASLLWRSGSGARASVVLAHGLSCAAARGIFPDQGSNPSPLRQQADSSPLSFRAAPNILLLLLALQEWQWDFSGSFPQNLPSVPAVVFSPLWFLYILLLGETFVRVQALQRSVPDSSLSQSRQMLFPSER